VHVGIQNLNMARLYGLNLRKKVERHFKDGLRKDKACAQGVLVRNSKRRKNLNHMLKKKKGKRARERKHS